MSLSIAPASAPERQFGVRPPPSFSVCVLPSGRDPVNGAVSLQKKNLPALNPSAPFFFPGPSFP